MTCWKQERSTHRYLRSCRQGIQGSEGLVQGTSVASAQTMASHPRQVCQTVTQTKLLLLGSLRFVNNAWVRSPRGEPFSASVWQPWHVLAGVSKLACIQALSRRTTELPCRPCCCCCWWGQVTVQGFSERPSIIGWRLIGGVVCPSHCKRQWPNNVLESQLKLEACNYKLIVASTV